MARNKKAKFKKKKGSDKDYSTSKTEDKLDIKPEEQKDPTKSETNDAAWYMRDPALALDSGNLPWSDPLGRDLNLSSISNAGAYVNEDTVNKVTFDANSVANSGALPGILSLKVFPTIGYAKDRTDPVNLMANQIYTQARYVNSGRKNYDPCDLLIYILTIEELYSFLGWCRRLYGYTFMYSQTNKYLGRALLEANGIDPDDFKHNLANFRAWLNVYINNISSYVIPRNVTYIQRKLFMYSGYYLENPYGNIKDQLYQFVPAGFLTFALDETSSGKLTPKYLGNSLSQGAGPDLRLKASEVMTFGDELLNNVLGDEDFGLMSGDLLKAFGSEIVTIESELPDGGILPIYDPFVLSQFKNASICDFNLLHKDNAGADVIIEATHGIKSGEIGQDSTGNIVSAVAMNNGKASGNGETFLYVQADKIFSVDNPAPGVGDTFECSRLTVSHRGFKDTASRDVLFLESGTEIIVNAIISVYVDGDLQHEAISRQINIRSSSESSLPWEETNKWFMLNMFKYAPMLLTYGEDSHKVVAVWARSNIDMYTVVGQNEIYKLHRCALYSLLFVPTVAKNVNYLSSSTK